MKIVFIGSGNVATHMAVALNAAGNEILQVYSRTLQNAASLACKVGAASTDRLSDLDCTADVYIFSVKDDILPEILSQMPVTDGIWAHTAGSIPLALFSPRCVTGVIYPLQTFSKKREVDFRQIPLFVEGDNPQTEALLNELAQTISDNVQILNSEKRRILHLAAVFACNFTNHMYTLASEIIAEEDMPFQLLIPLISETAAKIREMDPHAAQTGPAIRFDEKVMQKQIDLLTDTTKKEIYTLLSKSIHQVANRDSL